MSLSIHSSQQILNRILRGLVVTAPTTHYAICRSGTTPTTGTGIARQSIAFGAATNARPSVVVQGAEVDFGTLPANIAPASIDNVALYDALTLGNELAVSSTFPAVNLSPGSRLYLPATSVAVSLNTNVSVTSFETAYLEAIMNWWFVTGPAPLPAIWLGLLNGTTELTGTGYARVNISTWWGAPSAADPSLIFNSAQQSFSAAAGAAWGPATHWGLWGVSAGGGVPSIRVLMDNPINVNLGDPVIVPIGSSTTGLRVSLT